MTQTVNPTQISPVTTPVTASGVQRAIAEWADVRLADGRLVYPGAKVQFLLNNCGSAEKVAAYLNERAEEMARPKPLYQLRDVRLALENFSRLVGQGDFAAATVAEKDIWEGVLEAVATSNAQAGYLAAEALRTRDYDFPRS